MPKDDMGNPDNLTLQSLAKAAIAGNDGSAADFMAKTDPGLKDLSVEELQSEIDRQKSS